MDKTSPWAVGYGLLLCVLWAAGKYWYEKRKLDREVADAKRDLAKMIQAYRDSQK